MELSDTRGQKRSCFKNASLILCAVAAVFVSIFIAGCSPAEYKRQADEEVYNIIDSKWTDDLGAKANYHISGLDPNIAPPDENLIDPLALLPEANTLSLAQAVWIATSQNRDYQNRTEDLYLSALSLTSARDTFAPTYAAIFSGGYDHTETDEFISADGSFGFDQLLADGTEIGLSIAVDWLSYLTGDADTSFGSVFAATISKPLLRGAGKKVVLENLTQAERNVLYEIRSFNRFRQDFAVDIINQYYRVLQTLDSVENAQNNYRSLQLAADRVSMLADAGRKDRFEFDQAQQNLLSARDNLVRQQQRYEQQLDEFKITLAMDTETPIKLDPNELKALGEMEIKIYEISETNAIDTALTARLDFLNTKDRVEDANRKVAVAIDALRADLDLVASANVESTPDTDAARLRFHEGDYSVGAVLSLPIERTAERNAYRSSLITYQRRQRQYENQLDQVKLEVRQAHRELVEAAQRFEIQSKSLELAQLRVDSTSMLLKAGRVTTRDMLESQDALLSAQNSRTAALVDYSIAKLNFLKDIGILNIRSDGMYEEFIR